MMAWLILITIGANMAYKVREYGRADIADILIGIMATFLIYEAL
jgi:hypothetical protein